MKMTIDKLELIADELGYEIEKNNNILIAWDTCLGICLDTDDGSVRIVDEKAVPVDECNYALHAVPQEMIHAIS